ncbi:TetR/AcrR family transcriptional regulator [Paenibacillus monticola]|uniref:TetR family transcriptional regulator n=1 Tax=Paenibacillus monticola TaxID=2666075 RepID=A0A7X2L2W9_9BACL|nr:TetR/AcrR family transcriptional regulator [Paenibacillus monticola]MRN54655.1 TetR family transcriptional regulator [Paenibacillus monticola]
MSTHTEDQHDRSRSKLLKKLIASMMKNGFQQLRMDDIAKHMDVSRATMYKHFSSKEEVIEGVVQVFVNYIETLEERAPEEDETSFGTWFQQWFGQTVSLVGHITDVFLKDLQTAYPDLYDLLKAALTKREQQTLAFYRDGITKGIFNPINENFMLLQDDLLLREIINAKYLLYNQISIRQVLHDYYQFKKIQLFKAEKLPMLDDSKMEPVIELLVEKFNRAL